jgi:acyl carrier protein
MSNSNGSRPADASARLQLREFIETNFLYLEPDLELGDGDDLLELGVIDSLGFLELVEEVQARFGIAVRDTEITEENFGSIDGIVTFVEAKRGQ